jgi:uncharacterized RDD family membrane protein YckC
LLGGVFCSSCRLYLRDASHTVERVTYTRRIFGSWLLEGVLFLLTLGLGWLIWLFFAAKKAQSPAKSLTNIYIVNLETGRAVSAGEVWLRDVVLKLIVVNIVPFGHLVDAVWVLVDRDRQSLHDKIVKTVPVYAPNGLPAEMTHLAGAPALYQAPPVFPSSPPPAQATPTVSGVGEELRELKRLHDETLISDEEYERKRGDLVAKL